MRSNWEIFVENHAPVIFDGLDIADLDESSHNELFQKFLETKYANKLFNELLEDQVDRNYERNFGNDK